MWTEPLVNTLFVVAVESALFIIVPSAIVFNVKAFEVEPPVAVPPSSVAISLNVVPEPVSTVISFPETPAAEAVKTKAVAPSTAVTPIAAVLILATKLSKYPAVSEPVAWKNTGELSAV